MDVVVLGAGPTGLVLGAGLARRGHRVVAVDRDPGPGADGTWARRGVMQFEHAHGFRPQVDRVLEKHWPEALAAWRALGAEPIEMQIPGVGTVSAGHRSRRGTFERALRHAAGSVAGLEVSTGHIDGVIEAGGRVTGALVDGTVLEADLVIDATGRSGLHNSHDGGSAADLDGPCGIAYVDRTYQVRPGHSPVQTDNPIASIRDFDGYQVLVFGHEQGHFSVLFVRPTADGPLKALRHEGAFEAAARAVPMLAEWTDPDVAVPTSPVLVGGALRNTYRQQRGLPGLVAVGDSVATTTPTRGRGVAMAMNQVDALLGLLDSAEAATDVWAPFDQWCTVNIRPWVTNHIAIDDESVARWQGAELDLAQPLTSTRICEAESQDRRISAHAGPFYAMMALPDCLDPAEPLARAVYETGWRPAYAAGPTRDELVEVIETATG